MYVNYIVVDPNIRNGIDLRKILDGYEMLDFQGSFATFVAAGNFIIDHPPDIAFIFLGKAELNSFRLTSMIRERNPLSKVIFISSQKEYAVEAFEYGANGFLLMPLDKKKIEQLLKQNIIKK